MASESEEIELERVYTVPLRITRFVPRTKRAPRAIRFLRDFMARHMKTDVEKVKIMPEVNEYIWSRGIEKPPRKIRVRAVKLKDGTVKVYLVP
ncbi:MAG: 50S ribosomal protein L31e [Thermoprotei archaeon]|nr:MAG: 50S ribosomal protein L31e [Thermoprotei archaeon]